MPIACSHYVEPCHGGGTQSGTGTAAAMSPKSLLLIGKADRRPARLHSHRTERALPYLLSALPINVAVLSDVESPRFTPAAPQHCLRGQDYADV